MSLPAMLDTPWLVISQPQPAARLRLFCFPYAGGGAIIYRQWPASLPTDVEVCAVQPPGRETRFRETALTSVSSLVSEVVAALPLFLDRPFAFYGHSLGALVAFETAHELRQRGLPVPEHLFLASRRAPQLPDPRPPIHALPQADFVQQVQQRYGGIPEAIRSDAELMALFLPLLRADFTALETYRCDGVAQLDCPITVFGGSNDITLSPADLAGWQRYTQGSFAMKMFPGDHFFLHSRSLLLEELARVLGRYV